MKILGNRVLVSKVEEPKVEGFTTVEVQDSFINKGKVEQVGPYPTASADQVSNFAKTGVLMARELEIKQGDIVLFAKYSADTQEITHPDGRVMKIVRIEDVLAVL